ncbi:DUF1758 domain-containing protein [Trichonephila clavipes]|uniref:DUF1758 domain-containing protein n=1 Tax=Trichonephila clavipes TaxID=2585209 RepID=A0A8X6STV7_TRICX|nr:DUF1758 domain-containing protein [Trichonephila clavipes]
MSIGKFKKDELRCIVDELKLVVPDNAKVLDLRELMQESEIYKNDKEMYQAIVDCVLEEINDRRNENENRLDIEKIKLSQLEKELEIAKLHNQSGKSLPLQNENQLITNECNIETDYKFNVPGKIDVLLGAEIFYELLRPDKIYCGDSRLLLQNTVFGYVVSGSVGDEVRDNKIHRGLIRDSDLNTTLKSFRELKSIGVKNENFNSEEDVSLGVSKQRVHFKNDRYEVELPWTRDSVDLSDNFNLEKRQFGSPMRKMQSDKVYSEYCTVFRNYLDEGIIEKVTNPFISTNDPVLYFPHQVIIKNESLTTKQQIGCEASACERRVLKEDMGSEKSDEDMELPQTTERFIPLESERAKMLSVGPDAKAQPVTVPEEKCLPTALLIFADEMCEEKEERSVDVIKETAKEDISREPLNL